MNSRCLTIGRLFLALLVMASWTAKSSAQEAASPQALGRWNLETLSLKTGQVWHGAILQEREGTLDFAEIVQPAGKAMYSVVRGVSLAEIKSLTRLPPAEYQQLLARFAQFRSHSAIEVGRIDKVVLTVIPSGNSALPTLRYTGEYFSLESTADAPSVKRVVVRLEQVFRAFRTLLPPTEEAPQTPRIRLFGSLAEYQAALRERKLTLAAPACYFPAERAIWGACELTTFSQDLAAAALAQEEWQAKRKSLGEAFAKNLGELPELLRREGFSAGEIAAEIRLRRSAFDVEEKRLLNDLAEQKRRNEKRFTTLSREMFSRLFHEAFHAYLDSSVFPTEKFTVPRWLNEGLAQVAEAGQLDGDILRYDAPDPARRAALAKDLAGPQPLTLRELFAAPEAAFLAERNPMATGTTGPATQDQRLYLYAWGVAYDLTFRHNLLTRASLGEEFLPAKVSTGPLPQAEKLLGQSVAEYESQWRKQFAPKPAMPKPR